MSVDDKNYNFVFASRVLYRYTYILLLCAETCGNVRKDARERACLELDIRGMIIASATSLVMINTCEYVSFFFPQRQERSDDGDHHQTSIASLQEEPQATAKYCPLIQREWRGATEKYNF